MKKYNIVIILGLFLTFSSTQLWAQNGAPGLYGKKLFIEFGVSTGANLTEFPRYNENNKEGYTLDNLIDGVEIPLVFNYNYQLSAHYALSRLTTAGLGLSYGRAGFQSPSIDLNANIHSTNLNVFIRRYYLSSGSIAPIGRYAQFGVSAMFNNRIFSQSSLVYTSPEVLTSQVHVSPSINLEFGRETIINDMLLYSFAFQTAYVLPYGMDEESRFNGIELDASTMYDRLFSYSLFRFKFAVGLATLKMKK